MADIVSDIDKVTTDDVAADAPLSEAFFEKLGANINGLIDRTFKIEQFLSSGTWVAPSGVEKIIVMGCGGGGGGAGFLNTGGTGGHGAPLSFGFVSVVPGTTYNITVGNGGAGTAPNVIANGGDGFSSAFFGPGGVSFTMYGGRGGSTLAIGSTGAFVINGTSYAEVSRFLTQTGTSGGVSYYNGTNYTPTAGSNSANFIGGIAGTLVNQGSGGGAGPFGSGGAGGEPGLSPAANSGAGGGGGGGGAFNLAYGAAGGSGRVLIITPRE
jgi:hypothetical protein